jgi:hypothetical protein
MKITLPESSYGIVVLQEAWTKLDSEPPDTPGVLYNRMHWMGDFDSAESATSFIEQIPKIHAGSVQQILNEPGILGRVKVGAYALDTGTVGGQNIAGMCRLGSSDSASTNPDDALRIETIREILTTRHKPVLGTSFFLPATHVPPWREESAAEVIHDLQESGTWGLGKSAD